MELALLIVGAGLIGSIVAFAFYSIRTIVKLSDSKIWYAVSLSAAQADVDRLAEDILRHVDETTRLKSAIKALESSNAKLLANSKLTPADVIDTASERLRGLLPET